MRKTEVACERRDLCERETKDLPPWLPALHILLEHQDFLAQHSRKRRSLC